MIKSDEVQFGKAMLDCYSLYREDFNQKTIDLYFRLLSGYELQTVLNALESVLRSSKFFPKPAEIIEQIEGNEKVLIDSAYETARAYAEKYGFYKSATFNDQLITETIKSMGGLQTFCEGVYEDRIQHESKTYFDFQRNYSRFLKLKKSGQHTPTIGRLVGYSDDLYGTYTDDLLPLLLKPETKKLEGIK
jgi:hypothetical protein